MSGPVSDIGPVITAISYLGDVVFAVSGALTAGKYRMDVIGFVLIGVVTGIGGGTMRDMILDRQVFWVADPTELLLCVAAALLTYFFVPGDAARRRGMMLGDTLGLAAFCVVGCHVALAHGASLPAAVFMGMLTATGGGVIRDVITNSRPMILGGQLYATAALIGATVYALLATAGLAGGVAEAAAFTAALALRAAAIRYDIRMGPPGAFLRLGASKDGDDD